MRSPPVLSARRRRVARPALAKLASLLLILVAHNIVALGGVALADDGLAGKVMCGYQGWFRTPDDGSGFGWRHYSPGDEFDPDHCSIDLWPDVGELPAAQRVDTGFRKRDGSVAQVFSSPSPAVVELHFQWMKDYAIDGAFLQRFAVSTRDEKLRDSLDAVLKNVQNAATTHGRQWVLMYDLTGLTGEVSETVIRDWKRLARSYGVGDRERDGGYLLHRGKPLVALWGLGFSDRDPQLDDWRKLIDYFHGEGLSVMVGAPTYWRTLDRDAISDPRLHDLIASSDVLSPWTVGRYDSPEAVSEHAEGTMAGDLQWCRDQNVDYLPVVFPGFSWQNLSRRRGQTAPLDAIRRRGGEFMWSQFGRFKEAGAEMFYVAMFDELDEATAIFKFSNDIPVGRAGFVTEPGVPSDQYLWLTGLAKRLLSGEGAVTAEVMPTR